MQRLRALFIHCSPAGTTRHVAATMMQACRERGAEVREVDLARRADLDSVLAEIEGYEGNQALFIGSPVYVSHAVPPIMDFIDRLPENTRIPAVPFVTWGGVSSGMALFEMGEALEKKGLLLAGAARILAVHSMMWRSKSPLGRGHPDAEDDRLVAELAGRVLDRVSRGDVAPIAAAELTRHPESARLEMAKINLVTAAAHMPPRRVDEEICNQCGECALFCPTGAITLSPYPVFGASCILCFKCVRDCPEKAIQSDLTALSERIRQRAAQLDEQPPSEILYRAAR